MWAFRPKRDSHRKSELFDRRSKAVPKAFNVQFRADRELVQIFSGIFLSQKAKKRSSPLLDLRCMSFDCHSVGNLSVTGDQRARAAVRLKGGIGGTRKYPLDG